MRNFCVKPNTYIYLVVLIFLIPLKWLIAWIIAMTVHEACHWLSVKLCGGKIHSLKIGVGGAKMQCSNLPKWLRLVCILSGPLGGLLPILLARFFPRVAFCCIMLSAYNLLPVLPLDGGRALELLLGNPLFSYIEWAFVLFVLFLCCYGAFALKLGVLPLIIVVAVLLKCRKSPCKYASKTVQ